MVFSHICRLAWFLSRSLWKVTWGLLVVTQKFPFFGQCILV